MSPSKVIIVGGGIAGCSIAYHLSIRKGFELVLLEKSSLASGTSSRSAAVLSLHARPGDPAFALTEPMLRTYRSMVGQGSPPVDFQRTGELRIAETEAEMKNLQLAFNFMRSKGIQVQFLEASGLKEFIPDLVVEGLKGGLYIADSGNISPNEAAVWFANRAKENGAQILTNTEVVGFEKEGGKITGVKTNRGDLSADVVINAAGPWASSVAELAGVKLPLLHTKGQVVVIKPKPPLDYVLPVAFFHPSGFYVRNYSGGQVFACKLVYDLKSSWEAGVFDPDNLPSSVDLLLKEFIAERLQQVLPRFAEGEVRREWLGYRSVTQDFQPILDWSPVKGFFLAVGLGGKGYILSPGVGEAVAETLESGRIPDRLKPFGLGRFTTSIGG